MAFVESPVRTVTPLFFGQEIFCLVRLICVIAVSDGRYLMHRSCRAVFQERDFHRKFNVPRTKFDCVMI